MSLSDKRINTGNVINTLQLNPMNVYGEKDVKEAVKEDRELDDMLMLKVTGRIAGICATKNPDLDTVLKMIREDFIKHIKEKKEIFGEELCEEEKGK